jgi:ribosomal subunit interface protein
MKINVFGKGIDIGENLRNFAIGEVSNLIEKYVGDAIEASVFIDKDNRLFTAEIVMHLSKGFIMKSNGSSDDPYKTVRLSIEKLESRIKKHKHRIMDKQRRKYWTENIHIAKDCILERQKVDDNSRDEEHLIIAEQEKYVLSMRVSEAVAQLDLEDLAVVIFKNADSDKINVVYKRPDGHVGWIDYIE